MKMTICAKCKYRELCHAVNYGGCAYYKPRVPRWKRGYRTLRHVVRVAGSDRYTDFILMIYYGVCAIGLLMIGHPNLACLCAFVCGVSSRLWWISRG